MRKFTDSLKRDWTFTVDYQSIKKVRAELGIDLLAVVDESEKLLQRLATDEILIVDVISVLLTEQIQSKGMDERQFAAGMLGEGLQNAVDALIEGIADFSRPQKGAVIRKAWKVVIETHEAASKRMVEAMDNPALKAKVNREIDSALEKLTG